LFLRVGVLSEGWENTAASGVFFAAAEAGFFGFFASRFDRLCPLATCPPPSMSRRVVAAAAQATVLSGGLPSAGAPCPASTRGDAGFAEEGNR
jgi:hypothetical protein